MSCRYRHRDVCLCTKNLLATPYTDDTYSMVSHGGRNVGKQAGWIMITEVATEVIVDGLIAICVSYFLLRGRNKAVASCVRNTNPFQKSANDPQHSRYYRYSPEIYITNWSHTNVSLFCFLSCRTK